MPDTLQDWLPEGQPAYFIGDTVDRLDLRGFHARYAKGGTGDPHLQAAEENLSEVYQSPMMKDLHPWATYQAQIAGYKTVGIYPGALGFSCNA